MHVWWAYMCDFGEQWKVYRDENAAERPEDVLCSGGHEAVVLDKRPLADVVRVSLVSAQVNLDEARGAANGSSGYYIEVSSQSGETRLSDREYDLDKALERVRHFVGLTPELAWRRWDRLKMGDLYDEKRR